MTINTNWLNSFYYWTILTILGTYFISLKKEVILDWPFLFGWSIINFIDEIKRNKINSYQETYKFLAMACHLSLKDSFYCRLLSIKLLMLFKISWYYLPKAAKAYYRLVNTDFWRHVLKVSIDLLTSGLTAGTYSNFAPFAYFFPPFLSLSLFGSSGLTTAFVNFLSPKLKRVQVVPSHFFLILR